MTKPKTIDDLNHIADGRILATKAELAALLRSVVPEKKEQTKYLGKQHSLEQGWNNCIDQINTAINKIVGDKK